jgi:hypothetical protein
MNIDHFLKEVNTRDCYVKKLCKVMINAIKKASTKCMSDNERRLTNSAQEYKERQGREALPQRLLT